MHKIIGAGLSGLICGAMNAQTDIFERNKSDFVSHRAVLRFRDDKIARTLGLSFRKVIVRKSIWMDGSTHIPSVRLANMYSLKVRGILADNSVWNIASADRFIAPPDLHAILADMCGKRIHWDYTVTLQDLLQYRDLKKMVVNTSPLPVLLKLLDISCDLTFTHAPIYVSRFTIPNCDVYQTVYFPSPDLGLYRATLTGELLTVESVWPIEDLAWVVTYVYDAFGFHSTPEPSLMDSDHKQSFGKIAGVPDLPRKALLHQLTRDWGIYSVGRFGIWKNILLDDVYDDIAVVRRLMNLNHYDVSVERTRV